MSLTTIIETIFPVISTALTGITVIWPNVTIKTQPAGEHVEVYVMPTASDSVGVAAVDFERGYVQFSVRVKRGAGIVRAAAIAETIAAAFPRGLELSHPSNGQVVRFDKIAEIKPQITDGAWFVLPVLIRYTVTV